MWKRDSEREVIVGGEEAEVTQLDVVEVEDNRELIKRLLRETENTRRRLKHLEDILDGKSREEESAQDFEEETDVSEEMEDEEETPSVEESKAEEQDEVAKVETEEDDDWHETQESSEEEEEHVPVSCGRPFPLPPPPMFTGEVAYRYSNSLSSASTAPKFQRHALDVHRIPQREGESWHCECGSTFRGQGQLTQHVNYFTQMPRFSCPKCPVRFTTLRRLREHMRVSHEVTNLYSRGSRGCSDCGHVSANGEAHKAHRLANHPRWTERLKQLSHGVDTTAPEGLFRCLCGREFKRHPSLSVHLRHYNGPAPFRCTHCPSSFTNLPALRIHRIKVHQIEMEGRQFGCRVCAALFPTCKKLQQHVTKKHPEVKPSYKCRQCPAAFGSRKEQQQHMHRVHGIITWNQKPAQSSSSKGVAKAGVPFKCPKCPVEFRINSRLTLHMRRIHGMEDYMGVGCTACGTIFPNLVAMRRHKVEMHPELRRRGKKNCASRNLI